MDSVFRTPSAFTKTYFLGEVDMLGVTIKETRNSQIKRTKKNMLQK